MCVHEDVGLVGYSRTKQQRGTVAEGETETVSRLHDPQHMRTAGHMQELVCPGHTQAHQQARAGLSTWQCSMSAQQHSMVVVVATGSS